MPRVKLKAVAPGVQVLNIEGWNWGGTGKTGTQTDRNLTEHNLNALYIAMSPMGS